MKENRMNLNIAENLAGRKKRRSTIPARKASGDSQKMNSEPRMTMTVEEMGAELGVSRSTAYSLSQQPGFPSFAIGRRVLVSREGLQKWIERQCEGSAQIFLPDVEK